MVRRRKVTQKSKKAFSKSRHKQENMARDRFMDDVSEGHFWGVGTGGLGRLQKNSKVLGNRSIVVTLLTTGWH